MWEAESPLHFRITLFRRLYSLENRSRKVNMIKQEIRLCQLFAPVPFQFQGSAFPPHFQEGKSLLFYLSGTQTGHRRKVCEVSSPIFFVFHLVSIFKWRWHWKLGNPTLQWPELTTNYSTCVVPWCFCRWLLVLQDAWRIQFESKDHCKREVPNSPPLSLTHTLLLLLQYNR